MIILIIIRSSNDNNDNHNNNNNNNNNDNNNNSNSNSKNTNANNSKTFSSCVSRRMESVASIGQQMTSKKGRTWGPKCIRLPGKN